MALPEKKIRFSSDVNMTSSSEATADKRSSPYTAKRSAVKSPASLKEGFPPGSGRRLSENTDLHVSLNPNPEIIPPLGTPAVSKDPVQRVVAGEVANMLADIGSEGFPALRPLLLNLAGTLLDHKAKDPEQFIVDHLFGKQLGQSGSEADRTSVRAEQTEEEDEEGPAADDDDAPSQRSPRGGGGGSHRKTVSLSFNPVGATVADRLAFGVAAGPCKAVVTRLVQMLLSTKPEDAEGVLWTHLEASVGHTETCAPESQDDPTLAALLHELPADSPGHNVALKAILLLFAKRPSNPINYLFDHYSSRSRSNVASLCSAGRHAQAGGSGGVNVESCTSEEFCEEDRESIDGGLTFEQQRRVDGFLGSLPPKGDGATADSPHRNRRSRRTTRDSAVHAEDASSMLRRISVRAAAAAPTPAPSTSASFSYHTTHGTSPLHDSTAWRPLLPSAYVPSYLSPSEAEEQQRVRQEFELLRTREELRRERLLLELQSLRHEQEYRERVARLDGGPQTQAAARAATEALLEGERYLLVVEQQIAQLPLELHRQLHAIAAASPSFAWGAAVSAAATDASTASPLAPSAEPRGSGAPSPAYHSSRRQEQEVQALHTEVEVLRRRLDALTYSGSAAAAAESNASGHASISYYSPGNSSTGRRDRFARGI